MSKELIEGLSHALFLIMNRPTEKGFWTVGDYVIESDKFEPYHIAVSKDGYRILVRNPYCGVMRWNGTVSDYEALWKIIVDEDEKRGIVYTNN